jgi:hypothetical protein
MVTDTPASGEPTDGCTVGKYSCVGLEGLYMIENFMDYTDDVCMSTFTPGQAARIV